MNTNITLKQILTFSNLKRFFKVYSKFFKGLHRDYYLFIKKAILDSINCREKSFAKTIFSCPTCSHKVIRPVTCKSKFCTSCGKIYSEKWALKLSNDLIDKKHRHILFTLPKELWRYPIFKRNILAQLSDHIRDLFKSWFKKQKIKYFGLIVAIHTFGRDSNFHPHFHVLLPLGGFNSDKTWKQLEFFASNFFNNSWKHLVLTTIKSAYPNCQKTKKRIAKCYSKNFFVDLKGEPLKTDEKSIKYIGRYLMRPHNCRV